tara:strand:+ start:162 stop:446 length:285 start_codon:yes stop_codon:yes gene_type:complete
LGYFWWYRDENNKIEKGGGVGMSEEIRPGANLRHANLWKADLRHADLRGANLTEANLRRANLWKADLTGADLEGAKISAKYKDLIDWVEEINNV